MEGLFSTGPTPSSFFNLPSLLLKQRHQVGGSDNGGQVLVGVEILVGIVCLQVRRHAIFKYTSNFVTCVWLKVALVHIKDPIS